MKIGYINRYNLELNPQLKNKFKYLEANCTRTINTRGDKVRAKIFNAAWDYEEVKDNTDMLKESPDLILVTEPFFVDDELRERVTKWVDWANKAKPSEYDPFAEEE